MDPLGPYDSPTFLGEKDTYVMGLSLPELIVAILIAGGWFLVTLSFPVGVLVRLVLVVPLTGVSMAFLFVRISGLTVPVYILLSLLRMFRRPSFEESRELLLRGEPAWLELQRERSEGRRSRFGFLRRGRRAVTLSESRQAELKADMDRQITEGAVAAEQWAMDAVRSIMRGR